MMIATITLNPSRDEYIMVHGLIAGEANRWVRLYHYAGGKGIDVARAIREMGGDTIAYGFIGGDTGREVEIMLDEEGVPFSFTPITHETRTNFIITDISTFQQTRILAPGPPISKKELERFGNKLRQISPRPDMLVASGSIPPGVPREIYYNIVAEARERGVRTIIDTEGEWLAEGIKAKPYLIKPNVHEAGVLLGRDLPTEKAIVKAALELAETGIEIVVISRGEKGVIAASKGKVFRAVPPPVRVRSAVGAGDCTIAGLALKLTHGESLIEACRLAVAMGTAAVRTPGTQLSRKADVDRMLHRVTVEEIPLKRLARSLSNS
jgi:6-phosphofructokinase 2